jgi:hypothetical protein
MTSLHPKTHITTFARTLVAGTVAGQPLDVFIAGDDVAAKATISQLVEAGGQRAIDTGPLSRARQLEGMGFLGITLQGPLGTHFMSAWKLLFPWGRMASGVWLLARALFRGRGCLFRAADQGGRDGRAESGEAERAGAAERGCRRPCGALARRRGGKRSEALTTQKGR